MRVHVYMITRLLGNLFVCVCVCVCVCVGACVSACVCVCVCVLFSTRADGASKSSTALYWCPCRYGADFLKYFFVSHWHYRVLSILQAAPVILVYAFTKAGLSTDCNIMMEHTEGNKIYHLLKLTATTTTTTTTTTTKTRINRGFSKWNFLYIMRPHIIYIRSDHQCKRHQDSRVQQGL